MSVIKNLLAVGEDDVAARRRQKLEVHFYPPGTTLKSREEMAGGEVIASSAEELAFLESRGWIRTEMLDDERRQMEEEARQAAELQAEAERRAAEKLEKEKAAKARQEQEMQKAEAARKAAEAAKLADFAAKNDFLIQAALAEKYPLEERRKWLNRRIPEWENLFVHGTEAEKAWSYRPNHRGES